ncbi:MAG: SipW-dependent-type signal peptide-containing protein [Clostridia bacterium]
MNESTKTKKALRGSLFALFLCIVLLIGTTFAWFTDTASTGVNKIQSGRLDVSLEKFDTAQNKWVSAENDTLTFKTADNRTADEILWEPGCTYELPELRVVNNGNLALKYKLKINGIKGDEELNKVIDWTYSVSGAGGDAVASLDTERHLAAKTGDNDVFDTLTIKGHMQESAGNEYKDKSIDGISITVVATQDTVENDSFGNTYDAKAVYPVVADRSGGSKRRDH